MTTTAGQSYTTAPNRLMHASNGIDYAYREIGTGTIPLVLLQHFRGNLENWDPPLLDALASERRVIAFDNVGIGATTGTTPNTMEQMAHDALFFIDALEVPQVDILGFSIGSFVAQEIALTRPDVVRRLVLASSAPRGGAGMHGWAPEVINAVGRPEPDPGGYLDVFFTSSPASRQAARRRWGAYTDAPSMSMNLRPGQADWRNMMPCAIGESPIMQRYNASARSVTRFSSLTATGIR